MQIFFLSSFPIFSNVFFQIQKGNMSDLVYISKHRKQVRYLLFENNFRNLASKIFCSYYGFVHVLCDEFFDHFYSFKRLPCQIFEFSESVSTSCSFILDNLLHWVPKKFSFVAFCFSISYNSYYRKLNRRITVFILTAWRIDFLTFHNKTLILRRTWRQDQSSWTS